MCEMPPEPEEGGMCEQPKTPLEEVTEDGRVTPNEHLDRNKYNQCPTQNPGVGTTDSVEWWKKTRDYYHRPLECLEGAPTDGSLGPSSYECCYYPTDGQLVDNTPQSGTFNFYNSKDYPGMHAVADLAPHVVQNQIKGNDYNHVNMSLYRKPSFPRIPSDEEVVRQIRESGIPPIGNQIDLPVGKIVETQGDLRCFAKRQPRYLRIGARRVFVSMKCLFRCFVHIDLGNAGYV